ncbi:MAG: AAA family ATPase [Chlamydiota bacterium]
MEIRFAQSASINYERALKLAAKFSSYRPDPKAQSNLVLIGSDEFFQKSTIIQNLYETIKNWKSTSIKLNGNIIAFNEVMHHYPAIECYGRYKRAVIQDRYCLDYHGREGWGCNLLTSIERTMSAHAYSFSRTEYWFSFGSFVSEYIWKIDKDRLLSYLKREATLKNLHICEIFSLDRVASVVNSLPDTINVKDSDLWSIDYDEGIAGDTKEKKAVGVIPKSIQEERESRHRPYGIGITLRASEPSQNENPDIPQTDKDNVRTRHIPEVYFSDIGGIDDIIGTIREVIELPIKRPDLFKYMGIKPHKGVLLHGPPGCGKTLIAKAIASEIRAHFASIKGPEIISKWHGQSEENLRDIFEEARDLAPSIIFFDEIDSIAQNRSDDETLRFDSRIVNQLLTLMDGIEDYGNVRIIASTNRIDLIDQALLRPGRFDYTIEINRPTKEGCRKIFEIYTKGMPIENSVNIIAFSEKLIGLTGADISFIAREGAYNCLRRCIDMKRLLQLDASEHIDYSPYKISEDDFLVALNKFKPDSI